MPASATLTSIDGAVHSFFGDNGAQPGDGTPTISHDQAPGRGLPRHRRLREQPGLMPAAWSAQAREAKLVGPGQGVPMASERPNVAGSSRIPTMWVATSARVIMAFIGRRSAVSCTT